MLLLAGVATSTEAQTVIRVAGGLSRPVFATSAPGDPSRLFIVEKGGSSAQIKILNLADNTINPTPFLTVSGLGTSNEQGLLGMAFDPNYATNGRFYLNYVAPGGSFGNGVTHIARYTVSADPNIANAGSKTDVLTFDQPQTNHNGGWIGFSNRPGDAGNLYIASGDGGNGNDQGTGHTEPGGNAQNPFSLLGKMLRIDVATPGPAAHPNYSIPSNNPFASGANGAPEVFLTGLRNPFRNSFDTANGNLMIADVGQENREEIDVQKASNPGGGENYGWRLREGTIQTPGVGGSAAGTVGPILDYPHSATTQQPISGISVIGGYVYHGDDVPSLQDKYIFGDLAGPGDGTSPLNKGRVFSLNYNGTTATGFTDITTQLFTGTGLQMGNLYAFGTDGFGELYIVDGGGGALYRIVEATVPGDGNHDGLVNGEDLTLIASRWLTTGANQPADVNFDRIVNGQDITLAASHWLERSLPGGSGLAVPEPSTFALSLLCLAGAVLWRAARRR